MSPPWAVSASKRRKTDREVTEEGGKTPLLVSSAVELISPHLSSLEGTVHVMKEFIQTRERQKKSLVDIYI